MTSPVLTPILSDFEREFWMRQRAVLIQELGNIEDYLGLPRSIQPRHRKGRLDELKEKANQNVLDGYKSRGEVK